MHILDWKSNVQSVGGPTSLFRLKIHLLRTRIIVVLCQSDFDHFQCILPWIYNILWTEYIKITAHLWNGNLKVLETRKMNVLWILHLRFSLNYNFGLGLFWFSATDIISHAQYIFIAIMTTIKQSVSNFFYYSLIQKTWQFKKRQKLDMTLFYS